MTSKTTLTKIKKGWRWIWDSDSMLSWVVALILIFVMVKFIFFPGLSLIMGTELPLAGVESSSMDHQIVKDSSGRLSLCEKTYPKSEKQHINFNEYWDVCGNWYEEKGITKSTFSGFSLKNGFRKGDIIIVWGRFKPKLGDIIIFKPNPESMAPRPIIHRIVGTNGNYVETKGDHNQAQLTTTNNLYRTDETAIPNSKIIGKAIFKIPYLGWVKIWFVELLNVFKR